MFMFIYHYNVYNNLELKHVILAILFCYKEFTNYNNNMKINL